VQKTRQKANFFYGLAEPPTLVYTSILETKFFITHSFSCAGSLWKFAISLTSFYQQEFLPGDILHLHPADLAYHEVRKQQHLPYFKIPTNYTQMLHNNHSYSSYS
jgi:hypothetical protein